MSELDKIGAKIRFLLSEVVDDSISLISNNEIHVEDGATGKIKLKLVYLNDGEAVEPSDKDADPFLFLEQDHDEGTDLIMIADIETIIPALIKALQMIRDMHLEIDEKVYNSSEEK